MVNIQGGVRMTLRARLGGMDRLGGGELQHGLRLRLLGRAGGVLAAAQAFLRLINYSRGCVSRTVMWLRL